MGTNNRELENEVRELRRQRDELAERCAALEKRLGRAGAREEAAGDCAYTERYLRSIINTEPECVKLLDPAGTLVEMNPAGLQMIGADDLDEVKGRQIYGLVAPEHRAAFRLLTERVCRGETGALEFRAVGLKGREVWLETHAVPFRDDRNDRTLLLGITRDVTERKRHKREQFRLRNLESLGTLAGGIAHDFNNLLTSVFGNIELARKKSDPSGKVHALLAEAENAAATAKRLTNQLLTFAKGGEPLREQVSLKTLLRETTTFQLSGSNVRARFILPGNLWEVDADPVQLEQLVQNLVKNAREAMPSGGGLEVKAKNVEIAAGEKPPLSPGRYVRVSFTDDGQGIAEAVLHRIFDPYFTTKPARDEQGGGLGLSICHSIAMRHRGHIDVESREGDGSAFHVYLPAAADVERPQEQGAVTGTGPGRNEGRRSILVLEDEEIVVRILREILDHLDCDVEFGRTGEEVIAKYVEARDRGEPYGLVLLDLTIRGGLGGKDTLERLRELDPDVRAVASSGYVDNDVMANYVSHGFVAAVPKPFKVGALQDVIDRYLPAAEERI